LKSEFPINLLTSFIGNFVGPIFAILLPLLAYKLGADVFEVGLVGGVSSSLYAFVPFIAGSYSDRLHTRRAFILIALVLLAASSALYTVATDPVEIILFRIFEGMGWAILWPTLDTVVSEDRSRDPRRSLTIFNVTLSTASIVGPLVGGFLVFTFSDLRYVFVATTIMLVAALTINVVSGGFVRSLRGAPHDANGRGDGGAATSLLPGSENPSQRTRHILLLIIVLIFLSSVRGILFAFLPSLGQSVGVPEFLLVSIAFAFGTGRTFSFALSLRDDLRDRIFGAGSVGRNVLLFLAIGTVAGIIPLIPDRTGAIYVASMAMAGIATGSVTGMVQVEVIAKADSWRKGRGAGLLESSIGIGMASGPILAGAAAQGSLSAPFLFVPLGLIVVLPVSLYLILKLRR
jgi:MFS family permease